ncbi:MAG: tryptophan 7-halogenase [Kangiellaceae bacterium]|nr:tryptophan 7-halogenase [Kangiellaceae bacterium]
MSDKTKIVDRVLIVGGGTAGWLTAGILSKQLNSTQSSSVKVTLVESPNIPIMGVGEGTWPNLRSTLQSLGIDEGEFMRECDATFKQGTEFVNWMLPKDRETHHYYHPLSAVFHAAYDFNLAPYWLLGDAGNKSYDLAVSSQANVCYQGLAPKKITTPAYEAIQNYSYHLNANKFAAFLARHCVEKLGVEHLVANVTNAHLDEDGFIESVTTDVENIQTIKAGFFVDCSGSRSILMGDALDVSWKGIENIIFNDTALAVQVPYPDKKTPIVTHTIATAFDSGWTWDIGLHNRRGTGYVYSSNHVSEQKAENILRKYINQPNEELDIRKIKLNLGYREKFWDKNCVAIGMSAVFIEPLEASAIFLIDAGAHMLAEQFPRTREAMQWVEKKYNNTFRLRWEKTLDFVKMHYCISDRRDSQYWIDNCQPGSIPDSLKERLAHWKSHPPGKYDFDHAYEPFVLDSYLYVLYGMNFKSDIEHNRSTFADHEKAKLMFKDITTLSDMLKNELPKQRELVENVYKYGFQKI